MPDFSIDEIQKGLATLPQELLDMIAAHVLSSPELTNWTDFPAQLKIDQKTLAHYINLMEQYDCFDDVLIQFRDFVLDIDMRCWGPAKCICDLDLRRVLL